MNLTSMTQTHLASKQFYGQISNQFQIKWPTLYIRHYNLFIEQNKIYIYIYIVSNKYVLFNLMYSIDVKSYEPWTYIAIYLVIFKL